VLVGRCYCGAVSFRVEDAFVYASNCHCSYCRRTTGSAFKPFAGIERKVEVVDGRDSLLIVGDDEPVACGPRSPELSGDLPAASAAYAEAARRATNVAERDHLVRQALARGLASYEGTIVSRETAPTPERRLFAEALHGIPTHTRHSAASLERVFA
jgi:hypothetical protein